MTEEPTGKLYALAVVAIRTTDDQPVIGVHSALALVSPEADIEDGKLEIARQIFPTSDGWDSHYVNALEISQGFPIEPHRLMWRLEKPD